MQVEIQKNNSYKIGIDEVVGLKQVMTELMAPIQRALKAKIYWNTVELKESEYERRDGFIPHSHNCGGLEIHEVIPKCEEYDFSFLEFGEYETDEDYENDDGHFDAALRIWFKFEGIDDNGEMSFWLYVGGGNGDAPYFRTKYENDIFEESFTAKNFDELRRNSSHAIGQVVRILRKG